MGTNAHVIISQKTMTPTGKGGACAFKRILNFVHGCNGGEEHTYYVYGGMQSERTELSHCLACGSQEPRGVQMPAD
jgi:hypothetical protein